MDICTSACERHAENNESAAKMIKVFCSLFCELLPPAHYNAMYVNVMNMVFFCRRYWTRSLEHRGTLLLAKVLDLKYLMNSKTLCTCSLPET